MMTDYPHAWKGYRKLRNQLLVVLVGYFPVVVCLFIILPVSGAGLIWGLANLCWLAILAFVALRLRNWRCPRCGERFFVHSERSGLGFLSRNCGNCQLPKYSD